MIRVALGAHVVIVLPHTDGELGRVLADVEEALLLLEDGALDDGEPRPDVRAARDAICAVGRLASCVAALDRQPPAVQPVAPDGRFELVPLLFVRVWRRDLALVIGAVRHLAGAVSSHESVLAAEALDAVTLVRNSRSGCVAELRRLESLLLPRDDDVAALHAVLDRGNGASGDHGERVVRGVSDYAAYQRVTDRILATWHRGDCLARFLYRGVG